MTVGVDGDLADLVQVADPAFYDDPRYANGVSTMLKIFPHGQSTATYSVLDSGLYIAGKGVLLSFAWNGFDSQGKRALPGAYDVEVTLLDSLLQTLATTREDGSIQIGGVSAGLSLPGAYLNGTRFGRGGVVSATCKLTGTTAANTVKWRVRDANGNVVYTTAVGATGIFQCDEVFWQLQGKYDTFHGDPKMWTRYGKQKPGDWESLQVKAPRRGLAISHAGVGSHVTCAVLEKGW